MVVNMNIIEIKNLNFKYDNKTIFKNLNLNIKKNSFITILGSNGSGKSTLARLITSKHKNILIKEESIGYISSNPDEQIVGTTVKEQLTFYLKQQNLTDNQIRIRLSKIIKEFSLEPIINQDPYLLENDEKQLIILLSNIISEFKIIVLDDALCLISCSNKDKLLKYLKKKKRTIINITNDTEECIYGTDVAIINKNIVLNKPLKEALNEEKIFIDNSLKLPFMAELSLKLKYYNLLDELKLDIDEMVKQIWN